MKHSNDLAKIVVTAAFLAALFSPLAPGSNAQTIRGASATRLQADKEHLIETYGKLPLSFEANAGQTSSEVKFLSRGSGYTLFLTRHAEAVLVLQKSAIQEGKTERVVAESTPPAVLRMKLAGPALNPEVAGLGELAGRVNYFVGKDPREWHTDVPTYARVNYSSVYPGIDLAYYGNRQQLEYDFIVAPHADPQKIAVSFEGAEAFSVDPNGDLVLTVNKNELRFRKPEVYQEIDGRRREIASTYTLKGKRSVGFEIAAYDPNRPLIIDPTLVYSTYLGGSMGASGQAIAVDQSGNAFIAGSVVGTDFPTTPGAFQTTGTPPCINSGIGSCPPQLSPQEAFVTEINPQGSALVFSTYLGGSYSNTGTGIALDTAGNAYVTGYTDSIDFPVTPGAWQPVFQGSTSGGCMSCATYNSFVTKLNPSGNGLIYSTFLGGFGDTQAHGVAVDSAANAYVAGIAGRGFPTTSGAFQPGFKGACCNDKGPYNAFVAKLNSSGSGLVYATYVGGSTSSGDDAYGIALDAAGEAYIAGFASSKDFPTTAGAFQSTAPLSSGSAFVTKLNADGSALVYSTYLGGPNPISGTYDAAQGIAVDSGGNAYVTGITDSRAFPTTLGAFQAITPVKSTMYAASAFLTKLNPTGSGLVYSTYLGGSAADYGLGVAVDSSGDAFVIGTTDSTNFPTTPDAMQPTPPDNYFCCHAFVTAMNPAGSAQTYSSYLGGSDPLTQAQAITVDSSGNAYIVGATSSTTFPTTPGAFQTANPAAQNHYAAFIMKIAGMTSPAPAVATAAQP
jgi:hypothetical protein